MRSEARLIGGASVTEVMADIGLRARAAARSIAVAPAEAKTAALHAMAAEVRARAATILAANAEDVADAGRQGLAESFVDRLTLTPSRPASVAAAIDEVAELADPVGRVLASWERPNGLKFERVATPLGVVGIIYESRPNVTADAGALCLKSGNAAILRGGSDSFRSSAAIVEALRAGIASAGLDPDVIQLVPTRDRAAVGAMLAGLDGAIDVIVPRGGKSLVALVQAEARLPVFSHLEGICHVFIHAAADLDMAKEIVVNAKLRRTGVCGAAETLLIDRAVVDTHLVPVLQALADKGCEIRGDLETRARFNAAVAANERDWSTEYLDAVIAVRVVDGLDGAVAHISDYGSHHTDAIISADPAAAEAFLARVDSAIVLWNASTQFADGGEFGFGGEIGIATGRMHARGPVGVDQLCTFNYRVRGSGQIRP
eukprot:gene24466-26271_t